MSKQMPVLKVGALAYFDSLRCGLVPCKVVSMASGDWPRVAFKVTEDRGAYKRGEVVEGMSPRIVVPRDAVRKGRYSSYILPYKCDFGDSNAEV